MTKLFSRPRCQDVIGGSSVPGAEVGNDYLTGKHRKKPHYAAPELPKKTLQITVACWNAWLSASDDRPPLSFAALIIFLSQESPILGSYKTLSLGYGPSKMSKLRTITPATFATKMPKQLFLKFSAWGGVFQGWPKTLNFFSGEELPPVVKKANDQEDDQKDHASRSTNHTHAQPRFDGRCVQEACLFRGAAEGVGQDSNKKEVGQR